VQDKEAGDRGDRTRLSSTFTLWQKLVTRQPHSCKIHPHISVPLTGVPEQGGGVHRAHYCYYCITPLPSFATPNNRAATHSRPSASWCHRNAHLHSEAQPCANKTAWLQLLTRPYEDHNHGAGTTKHLCRKTSSSLHAYHRLHPTSLDRSRHLMNVRS
jgi:hypothetical protein